MGRRKCSKEHLSVSSLSALHRLYQNQATKVIKVYIKKVVIVNLKCYSATHPALHHYSINYYIELPREFVLLLRSTIVPLAGDYLMMRHRNQAIICIN